MTRMIKDIKAVDPELDVVDMTHLKEDIISDYDDEVDDSKESGDHEYRIRSIFVQATNDGMQS